MGTPPVRPTTTVFMQSNTSTAVSPPKNANDRSMQRRNEPIARDSTNSRYSMREYGSTATNTDTSRGTPGMRYPKCAQSTSIRAAGRRSVKLEKT